MSEQTTVAELREKGYKVRVSHRRKAVSLENIVNREFRKQVRDYLRKRLSLSAILQDNDDSVSVETIWTAPSFIKSKGGTTTVEVTTPTGETYTGTSKCCKSDAYNRKRGVQMALGRALKAMHKQAVADGDFIVSTEREQDLEGK